MLAIYKKEFKSYFISMIGYAFIAFLLLIISIMFSWINLRNSNAFIGYSLEYAYVTVVFMILVPVVTMKILADERRLKTDQLLFTSPVSIGSIVIGKYLAIVSVFAIPMLILCIYPIILTSFGVVPMAMSYVSILGFFLMGLAYLAIGVFVSSTTDNQIISAVVTFALLLLSFMMSSLVKIVPSTEIVSFISIMVLALLIAAIYYSFTKNLIGTVIMAGVLEVVTIVLYIVKSSLFQGAIQKFMLLLSLNQHYNNFMDGYLDLTGILYYLSIIGVFLFLAVQMIQKKKWN